MAKKTKVPRKLTTLRGQRRQARKSKRPKAKQAPHRGGEAPKPRASTRPTSGAATKMKLRRPTRAGKAKSSREAPEIQALKRRWNSLSPLEKGVELKKLLPKFGSKRALAGVIGLSEGRVRNLIKEIGLRQGGTPELIAATGAGETPVIQTSVVAQPPPPEKPAAPLPEGATTEVVAADYPIEDPKVGAELLAEWIRSNFISDDWENMIKDFQAAGDGNRKRAYYVEAEKAGGIPIGGGAKEVINLCRPPRMEGTVMLNDVNWRFKWFAWWSFVVLPDPRIRSQAVGLVGKLLFPLPPKWGRIYIDTKTKQPTVHLPSEEMAVADYLEKLVTPLLDVINILPALMYQGKTPLPESIKLNPNAAVEVLRYAAATVREGRWPS